MIVKNNVSFRSNELLSEEKTPLTEMSMTKCEIQTSPSDRDLSFACKTGHTVHLRFHFDNI